MTAISFRPLGDCNHLGSFTSEFDIGNAGMTKDINHEIGEDELSSEETRTHPVTGATMRRDVRNLTLEYRGLSEEVDMPGWYADDDVDGSDGVHTGKDMRVSDAALKRMKEQLGEPITRTRRGRG